MVTVMHPILRAAIIFFGLVLLLFGVFDLVTPRARFVGSKPLPGSVITSPPPAVIVNFTRKLSPESVLDVTSTIRLLPSGELEYRDGSSVVKKSGIDPGNPGGTSMRAELKPGLDNGLYWVSWRAKAAGWRSITYGRTYFAVGMPVPENITRDMDGSVWERNYQWRRRRAALVGGVVLIALWLLMRKRERRTANSSEQ